MQERLGTSGAFKVSMMHGPEVQSFLGWVGLDVH